MKKLSIYRKNMRIKLLKPKGNTFPINFIKYNQIQENYLK